MRNCKSALQQGVPVSLARGTGVSGHEIVVFLFPGRLVLGDEFGEGLGALLLQRVLFVKSFFQLVVSSIVLLVRLEYFGVVRHVLLIWSPGLCVVVFGVGRVVHVEVNGSNVVVVDTVLNVFQIVAGHGHAGLTKSVNELSLWVLELVLQSHVFAVNLFSETLLGLFAVDLRELLNLKLVLRSQVSLFSSQISQVLSRSSSPDLSAGNSGSSRDNSTG